MHHVMPCYVIESQNVIMDSICHASCLALLCHSMLFCHVSCYALLWPSMLFWILPVSCHVSFHVSCHVLCHVSCHALLWPSMLFWILPVMCHVMLCYVLVCYSGFYLSCV